MINLSTACDFYSYREMTKKRNSEKMHKGKKRIRELEGGEKNGLDVKSRGNRKGWQREKEVSGSG